MRRPNARKRKFRAVVNEKVMIAVKLSQLVTDEQLTATAGVGNMGFAESTADPFDKF